MGRAGIREHLLQTRLLELRSTVSSDLTSQNNFFDIYDDISRSDAFLEHSDTGGLTQNIRLKKLGT